MEKVIEVQNLSKSYHGALALENFSISVERGQVFGLLGANGAGKSTSIECMLGLKRFDTGTVHILGDSPTKKRKDLFEKVGVQFQESSFQEKITVEELCEMTSSLYKNGEYDELLNRFKLYEKRKSLVNELSGGQRQRLFIILALIPKPEIVFLDELTTGLDARSRREVWKCLLELKQNGLTIFLTSHFMDEVEALCDCICILKKGKIIFWGTVEQAIHNSPYERLEDAYLWYTDEEETL